MLATATRRPMDLLPRPDGLVQHEREHWSAGGDVQFLNGVDDSGTQGTLGVFGPGFSEELPGFAAVNVGTLLNNGANSLLVRKD